MSRFPALAHAVGGEVPAQEAPNSSGASAALAAPTDLDPRTKMFFTVLVSTVVMSPYGARFVLPALALAVALAVSERAWRRAILLVAVVLVGGTGQWLLSRVPPSLTTATLTMSCDYLARFAVTLGVGAHLLTTTSPSSLNAAVRFMRCPRALAVTMVVVVRFLPVVVAEVSAVVNAMRLRSLTSPAGIIRHPVLAVERFVVPVIAASLRSTEDLSAAAILRGLGARRKPTALHRPRFGRLDAAGLLLVAVLGIVGLVLPEVPGVAW